MRINKKRKKRYCRKPGLLTIWTRSFPRDHKKKIPCTKFLSFQSVVFKFVFIGSPILICIKVVNYNLHVECQFI